MEHLPTYPVWHFIGAAPAWVLSQIRQSDETSSSIGSGMDPTRHAWLEVGLLCTKVASSRMDGRGYM